MRTSPCRGCGKPIVWGLDPDGKRIPLDPRAPVYTVEEVVDGSVSIERNVAAMVSHFATCPQASRFSGSKKSGEEGR